LEDNFKRRPREIIFPTAPAAIDEDVCCHGFTLASITQCAF